MQLQGKQKIANAHNEGAWSISWCQGQLVSGSLDGTVACWDLNESKAKFRSQAACTGVTSVVSLQDGSAAIGCFQDSTIHFFDLFALRESSVMDPGMMEAYSLSLSPGEDILVSGNLKGAINVWSMQENHERVATLPTNSKFILSTKFSIEGRLATSSMDGIVNVIDMSTQQIVHRLEAHAMPARSVAFSADGCLLYSASDDRHVSIFDIRSGSLIHAFSHEAMALSVDCSSNGRNFAVGCANGQLSLWDLGMRQRTHKLDAHSDALWSVQFDPSDSTGCRLASSGDDGAIHCFEIVAQSS